MCIAIVKPKNKKISDEYLKNCFNNNPDGAGLAYAYNDELYYVKGIFDVEQFIKAVREAEKLSQGDMLIHCRIGTSGLMDKNNCHPHVVNNRTVMIHNGILDINVPKNSKVSDTVIFVKEYLRELPEDFMKNKAILKLIEKLIGYNNKFAFLNNKGESAICNKKAGKVVDGIWYSNDSYSYDRNIFFFGKCNNNKCYIQEDDYEYEDEIYDYFAAEIEMLNEQDLIYLGAYPFINKNTYKLVPYSEDAACNIRDFISLEEYAAELYDEYMNKYEAVEQQKAS